MKPRHQTIIKIRVRRLRLLGVEDAEWHAVERFGSFR
jgi:hypothetical protein